MSRLTHMPTTVLICDDDPIQRRLLEGMVRKFGHEAKVVEGGQQALSVLTGPEGETIDLMILDLVMPDLDGMGVLERLREAGVNKPVIVQTSHGGIDVVVSAMRAGAADFVVKPAGAERLQISILNALKAQALEKEVVRLRRQHDGTLGFKDIISQSSRMTTLLKAAHKAASSTIPVLIEGDSGVGKELFARAIAGSGERKGKPFVAVNCGAIPANLVESILFGHEKGAFTGASDKHIGKFVEASGGTLFLDEVGELPLEAQVKLLRAIQEGEVDPVGAKKPVKVDLRIISATNRDLIAAVKNGTFREDLYYRLCVFPLTLPPLRERKEDVPELVRHFLVRFCAEEGKKIRQVSGRALDLLAAYHWPGNIRQLENTMFRAVVLCDSDTLDIGDFPQVAAQMGLNIYDDATTAPAGPAEPLVLADAPSLTPPLGSGLGAPVNVPAFVPPQGLTLLGADGHVRPMEEMEGEIIRFAVDHYRNQMSTVARRLGIGRSTLYRRLRDLGLLGEEVLDEA